MGRTRTGHKSSAPYISTKLVPTGTTAEILRTRSTLERVYHRSTFLSKAGVGVILSDKAVKKGGKRETALQSRGTLAQARKVKSEERAFWAEFGTDSDRRKNRDLAVKSARRVASLAKSQDGIDAQIKAKRALRSAYESRRIAQMGDASHSPKTAQTGGK
jgi:hypothetical protein